MIDVIAGMHGNFHDPGLFAAFFPECFHRSIHFQEGFLRRVLSLRFVAQIEVAGAKNRFLILIHKPFKSLIAIRSSVRARNIANVSISSYTHIDE